MGDNVVKYAVHARWLAIPAPLDPAVAGTRTMVKKQEKKSDGKRETHGCLHALDMEYGPHRLSLWISIEDTYCALVSAWPANAAVSFSLVCTLICKSWPAGIGYYSHPGHNGRLGEEWTCFLV